MPNNTSAKIRPGSMVLVSPAFPANPIIKEKTQENHIDNRKELVGNAHRGAKVQIVGLNSYGLVFLRCTIFLNVASWQTIPSESVYGEATTS